MEKEQSNNKKDSNDQNNSNSSSGSSQSFNSSSSWNKSSSLSSSNSVENSLNSSGRSNSSFLTADRGSYDPEQFRLLIGRGRGYKEEESHQTTESSKKSIGRGYRPN
jgi:hypothetical protein